MNEELLFPVLTSGVEDPKLREKCTRRLEVTDSYHLTCQPMFPARFSNILMIRSHIGASSYHFVSGIIVGTMNSEEFCALGWPIKKSWEEGEIHTSHRQLHLAV
jgi:hypothetical protein